MSAAGSRSAEGDYTMRRTAAFAVPLELAVGERSQPRGAPQRQLRPGLLTSRVDAARKDDPVDHGVEDGHGVGGSECDQAPEHGAQARHDRTEPESDRPGAQQQ